jgi:hypothetical protein
VRILDKGYVTDKEYKVTQDIKKPNFATENEDDILN